MNNFPTSLKRKPRLLRQLMIGSILVLALFAFELFNFDTTRFALQSFLGEIRFAGFAWATILAVAFCAIDFAGLARLFTPEDGGDESREIWYLTGAWLLGATMNAVMTWWAVSTVLVSNPIGNEILSRELIVEVVPVFVAVLVWLTRILFIGAITVAGEKLLHGTDRNMVPDKVRLSPLMQGALTKVRPQFADNPDTRKHAERNSSRESTVNIPINEQPTRVSRHRSTNSGGGRKN
jgi:hypothetical protein